jgi:hypothetical protein
MCALAVNTMASDADCGCVFAFHVCADAHNMSMKWEYPKQVPRYLLTDLGSHLRIYKGLVIRKFM